MKVLDLHCDAGHRFEGWFSSEEDYLAQKEKGFLTCPVCGSSHVNKALSAPRLNAKSNSARRAKSGQQQELERNRAAGQEVGAQERQMLSEQEHRQLQAQWLRLAREMVAKAEDVGDSFAQEARRMHEGEAPQRSIYGQTTLKQARELWEDGIAALPLPAISKETVQ